MSEDVRRGSEWLAGELSETKRRLSVVEARKPMLAYSSIEDGSVDAYDVDGTQTLQVGKQSDGTHTIITTSGPKPPQPVVPSLKAMPGVVEVRWSGKFTDDSVSPLDFKHVAVHVSRTPVVDVTPSTQVATIRGELGDVAVLTQPEGMVYVALVAWSLAGKPSVPSVTGAVAVPGVADADLIGSKLVELDGKAQAATDAAAVADAAAGTAQTAADQANAAALSAAGIADSKGKVLSQSTAPGAADRNAVTLWIDTTGGANTPKRWSGSAWVAVTDKTATDAAAAAATAQARADAAFANAAAAMTAAGQAQASANGKNNVYYRDTVPSGAGFVTGDTVFIRSAVGQPITAQYQWDGSAWKPVTLSHQVIASVDLGKATVGELDGVYIKGKSIRAETLLIQGANLVESPDFGNQGSWGSATAGPGSGWVTGGETAPGAARSYKLAQQPAGTSNMSLYAPVSNYIPVSAGEAYRVTTMCRVSNAAIDYGTALGLCQQVYFYDETKTMLASQSNLRAGDPVKSPNYQWLEVGGLITAPAGAVYMRPRLTVYISAGTTPTAGHVLLGGVKVTRASEGDLIVEGAITAPKLESQLVLTSKVIAGNPDGTHAKMDPSGFKVLAAVDGGAPAEVIRMGTDTDDYFGVVSASGEVVSSITSAGDFSARSGDFDEDVTIGGVSVADAIDERALGLIGWASRYTQGKYLAGSTKHPYLSLQVDGIRAGRAYRLSTGTIATGSDTASSEITVYLHSGPADRAATVNDTVIDKGVSSQNPWSTGSRSTITFNRLITPSTDGSLSLLLSYGSTGGRGKIMAAADNPVTMLLEDIGLAMPQVGEWRDGTSDAPKDGGGGGESTAPPPVKTYDDYIDATGIRSFTGAGATYAYNPQYMYSGLSPAGYGDLSSMAVFPNLTSRLTGATITGVWVYVYYDFWYQGSGGTPYLSWHGQTGLTSTRPARTAGPAGLGNWPRASGKWVAISSSIWAGIKSGTHRGIMLGNSGGGYERYGYAHNPRLRIKYYK